MFTSTRTPNGGIPVEMTVTLTFFSSSSNLLVPLTAASTSFFVSTDGSTLSGQINGAVHAADIEPLFAPAVAGWANLKLSQEPPSGGFHMLFDDGGTDDMSGCTTTNRGCRVSAGSPACRNPAYGVRPGMCADACDNIIDTCEVTTNAIIQDIDAPDLRLFADDGSYAPQPSCGGGTCDALSFGVGFIATAIPPDATADFGAVVVDGGADALAGVDAAGSD